MWIVALCMIIAWIIVRPGRAAHKQYVAETAARGGDTVVIVDGAESGSRTSFTRWMAEKVVDAVFNRGRAAAGGEQQDPGQTQPDAAGDPASPESTTGQTPDPEAPEPEAPPAPPTDAPAAGGDTEDDPASPTTEDPGDPDPGITVEPPEPDKPKTIRADAERIWPAPPEPVGPLPPSPPRAALPPSPPPAALPPVPPAALPVPPQRALPGPSNGRSTTMTAIATTGSGALAGVTPVEKATPETTRRIGEQFDDALTKAKRLLDAYKGVLSRADEEIGGETTAAIARLRQGIDIAQAAAAQLAGRGVAHQRAAEPLRSLPDVKPAPTSYFSNGAR